MELTDIADLFGWAEYLAIVCGVAAMIATFAPPATDASPVWWQHVRRVLDVLAANFGHARNRSR